MRIRIPLIAEVDPKAWDDAFGCGDSEPEVRRSVRHYFLEKVRDTKVAQEGLATVEPAERSDASQAWTPKRVADLKEDQ